MLDSGWTVLFFENFKNMIPLSSLLGLWWQSAVIWIFVLWYVVCHFPLAAFKIFYKSLFFRRNLIIMCGGIVFFKFTLFGVSIASWICQFMSFTKYRQFSAILSLNIFSASVSFFSHSENPMMLDLWWLVPQIPEVFLNFYFVFCFFSLSVAQIR